MLILSLMSWMSSHFKCIPKTTFVIYWRFLLRLGVETKKWAFLFVLYLAIFSVFLIAINNFILYLTVWIKYMFMKMFMVYNIINFFQSLYLGCFFSIFFSWLMSIVFSLAIASVFLLGQNSVFSWFNLPFSVLRCPFARWTPSQSMSQ